MSWQPIGTETGVLFREYEASGFGRTSSLAIRMPSGFAVLSPTVPESPEELDALGGPVVALVAPHAGHTLGFAAWRARWPEAVVYAAPGSAARLREVCGVEARAITQLDAGEGVRFFVPRGSNDDSLLLVVHRGPRGVVYVNEICSDLDRTPGRGPTKALFWLFGTRPGLRVNAGYLRMYVRDRRLLAEETLALLTSDPYVVLAHGPVRSSSADLAEIRRMLEQIR